MRYCFNPWFAGSLLSNSIFQQLFEKGIFMFQSLVCWKFTLKYIMKFNDNSQNDSFNPWFAGSLLSNFDLYPTQILMAEVSILGLLEVYSQITSVMVKQVTRNDCFNPWFAGSLLSNGNMPKDKKSMELSFNPWFAGSLLSNMNLSISTRKGTMCFNPWFAGSLLSNNPPLGL